MAELDQRDQVMMLKAHQLGVTWTVLGHLLYRGDFWGNKLFLTSADPVTMRSPPCSASASCTTRCRRPGARPSSRTTRRRSLLQRQPLQGDEGDQARRPRPGTLCRASCRACLLGLACRADGHDRGRRGAHLHGDHGQRSRRSRPPHVGLRRRPARPSTRPSSIPGTRTPTATRSGPAQGRRVG